jgi:signal transduction histidine kinase
VSLSQLSENVSLDYISHSSQGNTLKVLIRATNRGTPLSSSLKREISLYGDGKLIDVTQTEIEPGVTKTVYFDKVSDNVKYLSAEITEKDDLAQDNIIYEVVSRYEKKKVLLLTDKNVFIERALSSIENLELAITTSEESLAALKAQFAEERAAEAAILTENGETELADDAAEEYMETIASAADHLNNAIEQKDEATAAMNELIDAYAKSQSILQVVLDKAPESAKAVVQEALNNQDGAISAIQGFYAAKSAFFAAKQELEAAKQELESARASGDEEAIKAAETKVASAEAYKDEMEALKDAVDKFKEVVRALVE